MGRLRKHLLVHTPTVVSARKVGRHDSEVPTIHEFCRTFTLVVLLFQALCDFGEKLDS